MGAGRTVLVSTAEGAAEKSLAAIAPVISADGSTVAFQAMDILGPQDDATFGPSRIDIRDVGTGTSTVLEDPEHTSWAPSLSGDGQLVAYQRNNAETSAGNHVTPRRVTGADSVLGDFDTDFGPYVPDVDVRVADLSGPTPIEESVTGTTEDVRYQRTPWCIVFGIGDGGRCGPQLSADGRTLAWGAERSIVSPALTEDVAAPPDGVSGPEQPPWAAYLSQGRHALAVVDFGDGTNPSGRCATVEGSRELMTRCDIDIELARPQGLSFGAVTLADPREDERVNAGEETFELTAPAGGKTACRGASWATDVKQGAVGHCTVSVLMHRTSGSNHCGTVFGRLSLGVATTQQATTPLVQSSVNLVGEDFAGCPSVDANSAHAARVAPLTCASPAVKESAFGTTRETTVSHQVLNLHQVWVGETRFARQRVSNKTKESGELAFSSPSCDVQLVQPLDSKDACADGEMLKGGAECIAYVAYRPEVVGPSAASLSMFHSEDAHVFRIAGTGADRVIVARRDPSGSGRFAGPGRPDAKIVSRDSAGDVVDGTSPSLSADGRYVAFASGRQSASWGGREPEQVYLHDTDEDGDGSFRSGATHVVSLVGGGNGHLPDVAVFPSLSGDGTRVAFMSGERLGGGETDYQVQVRDLTQQRTVLASAQITDATADEQRMGLLPSLSLDGSAVAFTSWWPDREREDGEDFAAQVYVRDLGPDFGGAGEPGPRIVSLLSGKNAGMTTVLPSIDGDGGSTVFQTWGPFPSFRVYLRARFAVLGAEPQALGFGTLPTDVAVPGQQVTLTNSGPGPGVVEAATDAPYDVEGCGGVLLHRGESCTVTVRLSSEAEGTFTSSLVGTATSDLEGEDTVDVELTGVVVRSVVTIKPGKLRFPETGIAVSSKPLPLRVANQLEVPVAVDGLVTDNTREFSVTTPDGCAVLGPGQACSLRVGFRPLALGARTGAVEVASTVDGTTSTQDVPVTGSTFQPVITFSPTVAQQGRVTFIKGEHFAPGLPVRLTTDQGPVSTPQIVPDDTGSFSAPLLVLDGGTSGPRAITLTMQLAEAGAPSVLGLVLAPPADVPVEADLMVVPSTGQPPHFVTRN